MRTVRSRLVVTFHREGEHGVNILRLTRLMNADIGAHGGTTAVTVRFTGQFLPTNTECRIRRSIFDTCQFRDFRHNSVNHMVELRPVHFTAQQGAVQRV